MSDSPIRKATEALEGLVDEVRNPQKLASDVAGIRAVFSERGAERILEVVDGASEHGRRIVGLPTAMDGHEARLDVRLHEIENLHRASTLSASERAFFAAYQHSEGSKLIGESAFLATEGHGAGLFVTLTDRAIERLHTASPLLGAAADKALEKVDWDQIRTVVDPAHAEHATNWQGICASVAVAAEIAPWLKPEMIAEKAAASAERQLARGLQREAEDHPQRFLHEAEKALAWANKHLPESDKKLFDKVLEKMTDFAKEHGKTESREHADLTAGDRDELARMRDDTGGTHTGKVIVVDADVVVQRVGSEYVRYNLSSLGGHVPTPGAIETLGNGVAKPLVPKVEALIHRLDAAGEHAPPLTDLRQSEAGKSYTGRMQHVEGTTYVMSVGRGEYVVFDSKADLHGATPPVNQLVQVEPNGRVGLVRTPEPQHR